MRLSQADITHRLSEDISSGLSHLKAAEVEAARRIARMAMLRRIAFLVGIVSSMAYLFLAFSDGADWIFYVSQRELILLLLGPLSLIGATLLAVKRERPAGVWLIACGIASVFATEYSVMFGYVFVVMCVVMFTIPMILEGSLFLLDARKTHHA